MSSIQYVVKRTGAVVAFNPERITNAIYRAAVAVGGRDRSVAERLSAQAVTILERMYGPEHIPTVEEIQDVVEKVLIENGHARTAKAYILYRDEQSRKRRQKIAGKDQDSGNIPYRKIWEVLSWAVDHDLNTVARMNARIDRGQFNDIVFESETAYEEDVSAAAGLILERRDAVRMVLVAGPSSSGKTTTTIKLGQKLKGAGLSLVALNVDNYYFDLALHPKDEFGDYDYETPQALDLELLNEHLTRLLGGDEVMLPRYDFRTGTRSLGVTPMRLGQADVILIDSLHGLYAGMTEKVPDGVKFKLYIETLLQMKGPDGRFIRWTDLRLLRRMVRDSLYRAYDPQRTLEHWHYVRQSEMRHIVPFINTSDYIVNSAMPYELCIMRPRLLGDFQRWAEKYRSDPLRQDAFMRAERVRELLAAAAAWEGDAAIPRTSLLREFIGGSSDEY